MLDTPSASPQKLLEAKEIAQKAGGVKYVYLGNIGAHSDTHCQKCNALLIKRYGFGAEVVGIKDGKCMACERVADVIQ